MTWTKSGTVSLTNNSAIVYGAGTTWVSGGKTRAGDVFIAPNGALLEVASIQSNTQLTLATAYLGTTASAQAYALLHIGLLPAELAVSLSDLQSKYLTTISQLYDWETSAAATVNLTNPATGVTAAVKTISQMIADLGGKVEKISILPESTNLNTVATTGFYRCQNFTNGPVAGSYYGQLIVSRGQDTIAQIYIDYMSGLLYSRAGNPADAGGAGSWSDWKSYATALNPTTSGTLTHSGTLLVGVQSGDYHKVVKDAGVGNVVFEIQGPAAAGLALFHTSGGYGSSQQATAWIGTSATTGRSMNAGGTFNAAGADYAEYERNNGLAINKGSIVGFKADGYLTLTYSEAVRFGVKSTDPSYVGGDTWGCEDYVGKRPEPPIRPLTIVEQGVITEAGDTDEEWSFITAQYVVELAAFESALDAARQLVDRIAYAGKVPVNVTGANPGGYIIASEAEDGSIYGEFVADPDFSQYKRAVGRVNRLLDDGRCEVAVMVH